MFFRLTMIAMLIYSGFATGLQAAGPDVPDAINLLMQDREYARAVEAIDTAVEEKAKNGDYLTYLKGRALHLLKQYDDAVAVFDSLQMTYPESDWARHARFAKGMSLARKGDYRAAELIYRGEAQYLFSLDRKQEIADLYLEFANLFFKPPKEEEKPDYEKALDFYQRALKVGPKPESQIQIELRSAECLQHLQNWDEAAVAYRQFLTENEDHALIIEARYRLGETLLKSGDLTEARRVWQDLLELHRGSESDRLPLAAFQISETHELPTASNDEDLMLGITSLRNFLKKHPKHELAPKAHLRIAESYHNSNRHDDAAKAIQQFLAEPVYADSEEFADARRLLGYAYQMQEKYDEALAAWQEFLTSHPTHSAWSEVQEEIVSTQYAKAQIAFDREDYKLAQQLWAEFLAKYPLDERGRMILYRFGEIAQKQEKWELAIEAWRKLVSKYPQSNEASQGQFMIAVTLEEKLGRLDEALKEYQKTTWGRYKAYAKRRIARLTAKSLRVSTERIFRSNETPELKLVTRNIECLTVQVYSVDMETYFRKMHSAGGIEALDIALIDPDDSFEFHLPDYREYAQTENVVKVPLPGDDEQPKAGVMAITVSSKTLEATTMIIQSDLDMIVKSSRDEVFVFAENMRTGDPWAEARLLLSDGDKVFADVKTDDQGVFHQSFKDLKSVASLRVFAIAQQHTASNTVGLNGLGVARGLTSKGYIYSDRSAYRPGQAVHLRGVIRKVDGDAYAIAEGKEYQVDVYDGRNRLIHDSQVALNSFGAFHTHLTLPTAAASGEYRVLVHDELQEKYSGTFTVQDYQLEPVQLQIESDRTVYYRGETIEGVIRASYYYGAPLIDQEIRYRLQGERVHTARTDEKGEVHFVLETRGFRETQGLLFSAEMPERNLNQAKVFHLWTQGFALSAETVRNVYLTGETFEVKVTASDAEGEPVERDLSIQVFKETIVEGQSGRVLLESYPVKSDAEGTARQTLKLDEGGDYLLRISGEDRFGNIVEAEWSVQISDDDDRVRLRILADQHTYRVGDDAQVRVHWREDPALALVTFQGAKILEYRLVQLKTGENRLQVPMTAKLAPNFDLAIAVMTDARQKPNDDTPVKRFHETSSPFQVQRDLRVTLDYVVQGDKKEPQPGDMIEVTLSAADPQGKPVSAEFSLAMVEQALLRRYPSQLPSIGDFFRDAHRQSAVPPAASVTFRYEPKTAPINPRLLAEEERLAISEEESRRLMAIAGVNENANGSVAGFDPHSPVPTVGRAYGGYAGGVPFGSGDSDGNGGHGADPFAGSVDQPYPVQDSVQSIDQSGQMLGAMLGGGGMGGLGGPGMGQAQTWDELGRLSGGTRINGVNNVNSNGTMGRFMFGSGVQSDAGVTGQIVIDERNFDFSRLAVNQKEALQRATNLGARLTVLNDSGVWFQIDGTHVTADDLKRRIVAAAGDQAAVMANLPPHETGYWNPAIVTDAEGKATVMVSLPDQSTGWKLLAKGITKETLAGDTEKQFAVSKQLFGQLKLASAFTAGDTASVLATVHSAGAAEGEIEVALKVTLGDKTAIERKTIPATGDAIQTLAFQQKLQLPPGASDDGGPVAMAEFELTVSAADLHDTVRRSVPVRPNGLTVFATAGGTAAGDVTTSVQPPKSMTIASPQLQILVGPSIERSLLDAVLSPPVWCQSVGSPLATDLDTTVSDLMASLALQKLLGATRDAGGPQAEALDNRVRSAITLLVTLQQDDGGWNWVSAGGESDAYHSARALWAISLARSSGYRIMDEPYQKAKALVQAKLNETPVTDYETKATLLHALTVAGQSDFTLANALYRNRPAISSVGLAYLALTFAEMDRTQTTGELLTLLATRTLPGDQKDAGAQKSVLAQNSWNQSAVEFRSLYALALYRVTPDDGRLRELVEWLMANRVGHRWSPDKATGPAMLAVCNWYAKSRFAGEKYKLTIYVNNLLAGELEIDDQSLTRQIQVPDELLTKEKQSQEIRFELTGRGQFSYQCVLGGFVPSDQLKSTTAQWQVTRYYSPAALEMDGQEIPRGFDVAVTNSSEQFRNDLKQLPVARRGDVELRLYRTSIPSGTRDNELPYLVVTEPLPAGVAVVENSVRGGFDRFELSPGTITFYVGTRRSISTIHYQVHGYLPGEFHTIPTVVRDAFQPEQIAVSEPKQLTVLPMGTPSGDDYRLSPRELYDLGQRHYDKGQFAAAAKHLNDLFNNWNLRPEIYRETVRMLLDIHLDQGPAAQVVRYFEIIIEKFPDVEISFPKLLKAGDAYHEIGEYERSYMVFRTTIEANFLRESRVAGFLESQEEFLRSVDVMTGLLRQYPPEPYAATASYSLAQRVYAKAPEASADQKLRDKGITRVDLIRDAWSRLDIFLTAHPDDPAADQASFSLANALLDLELYERAIENCNRYASRYPDSDYLDSYWYIVGYCRYAMGAHQQALQMCSKVAEAKRKDRATGRTIESPNKWQAIYIMGQIYHSLGQAESAIREYERVKDRFADALQAIDYFSRKAIELPEVSTVLPDQPVEIELGFRNVVSADVTVYRIDLMKFSLLRRNLSDITNINLAGIRPYHQATVELGDGKDYRDRTHQLDLPLKEEGAYLVVCRGDNLHASGMVLVSPLTLEIQEQSESGRVRTTVRNQEEKRYVSDVHVKVIGARNEDFVSGATDLRGIFVADSIRGRSTVIAQADGGRYAFYRGEAELGPPPTPNQPSSGTDPAAPAPAAGKAILLENLKGTNTGIQMEQQEQLQEVYDNTVEEGVGGGFGGGGFF